MRRLLPRGLSLRPIALTLAIVASPWLAPPGTALAQDGATQRLRGTIARVDGDIVYLKAANGQPVTVFLAPDATVTSVVPARLADIKPGRFVGTAARPEPGGRWRALEVHIFPVGSRLGEGHRPWAPEPGATMTNADVAAAAVKAGKGKMTLSTGGQRYDFDVPKGTPIVAMNPGTRALLKKGAHVAINQARPGAGGSYTTKNIVVTTVLNWPPS